MKIAIIVKPSSGKSAVEDLGNGSLLVHLKSAPVDGKANEELVRILSKYFHVTQKSMVIKYGTESKKKIVEILGK